MTADVRALVADLRDALAEITHPACAAQDIDDRDMDCRPCRLLVFADAYLAQPAPADPVVTAALDYERAEQAYESGNGGDAVRAVVVSHARLREASRRHVVAVGPECFGGEDFPTFTATVADPREPPPEVPYRAEPVVADAPLVEARAARDSLRQRCKRLQAALDAEIAKRGAT